MPKLQAILTTLQRELSRILGNQFETLYLYGSQARGEAQADSDIDVLVVIRGELNYAELLAKTSAVVAQLSLENDVVISRAFVSKTRFEHEQSPFLMNARRDAIFV